MRRFLLVLLSPALVAVLLAGCSPVRDPWKGTPPGQTRVLTSFPPLYCFTANVAKDKANVLCMLTSTGPHEYEASEKDARKVAGADLFFTNGVGLEHEFTHRLMQMSGNKKLTPDPIGDAIDPKLLAKMGEHDHAPGQEHDHHGDRDPHVWLGPKQAQAMVAVIAKKLADRDPANKDVYAKNAEEYLTKLKELEAYGHEQFKGKKSKGLITQHESLRYFADGFGLDLVDSIQPRPGDEANANRLAKLVDACKKRNVSVIAIEPQYNPSQAETLASVLRDKGVDVKIALVDPMETAPPLDRGNPDPNLYLDRMKANIDALAKAFP